MPNIKSAKKRVLVSKVNNERNKMDKSILRTTLKKAIVSRPIALTKQPLRPSIRPSARELFTRITLPAKRAALP